HPELVVLGGQALELVARLVECERLAAASGHRAMHEHALLPLGGARPGVTVDDALLVGDVDPAEDPADGAGNLVAPGFIDVEDRDPGAGCGQRFRGSPAQARSCASDDGADTGIDLHACSPALSAIVNGFPAADSSGPGGRRRPAVRP